jgi:DNA-binding NarL/FixJ family response regulator
MRTAARACVQARRRYQDLRARLGRSHTVPYGSGRLAETELHIGGKERTLLIVDDDQPFREVAKALLDGAGFRVVGVAEDGVACRDQAERLRPHVVLLDVQLPDTNGFDLCRFLVDAGHEVVLCSVREAAEYGPLVAWCGARAFVAKQSLSPQALTEVLDT